MKDFKIRKVEQFENKFEVEIEFLSDGEREKFGYPKGEGWTAEVNGQPRYVKNIIDRIKRREENKSETAEDKSGLTVKFDKEGKANIGK